MPTESTPSRNAETPSKQTPSRSTFRDLSNSVTKGVSSLLSWSTPTKPSAPATQSGAETPDPNGATPQPGAWQSADNFKFVEEDDDEVLFRVRDSGVLRSLTTPSFPSGSEDTSSGEDIEVKQVHAPAKSSLVLLFPLLNCFLSFIRPCLDPSPSPSFPATTILSSYLQILSPFSSMSTRAASRIASSGVTTIHAEWDMQAYPLVVVVVFTSGEGESDAPLVHHGKAPIVSLCPPRV